MNTTGLLVEAPTLCIDESLELRLEALKRDWPVLSSINRGRRSKPLVDAGSSRRKLARFIGCHESRMRQLLLLAEAFDTELEKLGTHGHGAKKTIAAIRKRRAKRPRPISKRRQKLILRNARLIARFVKQHGPVGPYREMLFQELKSGPYSTRSVEFSEVARTAAKSPIVGEPEQIIAQCKPSGHVPAYTPDRLNYLVEWFAGWSAYLIPDASLRYDAVGEAQKILTLE